MNRKTGQASKLKSVPIKAQTRKANQEEYGKQTIKWMSIQMAQIGSNGTQGILFLVDALCLGCFTIKITQTETRENIPVAEEKRKIMQEKNQQLI